MALETMKDVKKLGEFDVLGERPKHEDGSVNWQLFDEQRKTSPIYIDHDVNMISFKLQNGPVKQYGVNGCQVDTLIEAAKVIIEGLNKNFPCRENAIVITKLDEALHWLEHRKKDRLNRGVEGFNKS